MESYIARISQFERHLAPDDGQTINLKEFKDLCFGGIPDKPGVTKKHQRNKEAVTLLFHRLTPTTTFLDGLVITIQILLRYLPLDKTRWDSTLLEQRRLYYSFVKDLIVEPELGEADFIKDEREDSDWSLFLQDNKTLEQIDKDVRRTLPDFAFFQLPIPYSPLCPLSIEPGTRKPKQQHNKQHNKTTSKTDDTAPAPATAASIARTTANPNSGNCMTKTLSQSLELASLLLEAQSPPSSIPNYTNDSISMLSRSFPKSGFIPRRGFTSGGGLPSHLDLRTTPVARTLTPTLKRRQTFTLMSPRAEKKSEKPNEQDSWPNNNINNPRLSTENGTETPPLSNGFRTPVNTTAPGMNGISNSYSSPVPSRLRGMASILVDSEDEEDYKPMLPDYLFSPIPTRRSLFKRVAHLNQDFGSREHQPHTLQASRSQENWIKKRKDLLSNGRKTAEAAAAAMATAASPIDVPLSCSPESMMGDPQTSKRAAHERRGRKDLDSDSEEEDAKEDEDELPQDLHWEAIERILFIYAKLNPGVGYVQGMNEILGPLYYLLANDPDEASRAHAEAESFWLFHLLMAHFRDHFVRSLDRDRVSGIGSTIARMNLRLRHFDEDLWQDLEEKGIAPEYYSFRWLTVLCTQEFEVPDVWRIWDSVLADTGGVEKDYDFLLDYGCAMVCHLRSELLDGDFADNVKLLQNYPPVDIQPILHLAIAIRDHRINESFHYVVSAPDPKDLAYNGQHHQGHSSRRSIDFRIWTSSSNNSNGSSTATADSASDYGCSYYMDNKIDGVQHSDRLDHNLEGTDHRSPMYTPRSATFKKDKPPTISGLSLDGLWPRGGGNGTVGASMGADRRGGTASGLGVDNYMMNRDRDSGSNSSRPQTATWAEAFSLFKAKLTGSSAAVSPISPTMNGQEADGSELKQEDHVSFGTLIPAAEL
ncbi:hypothetical protein BGZ95_004431 [Linnemannia exigua]|uniref:Rab-GAP TBC domain-containing protein n=1 Tax=Linnemannia exigua TaxID=604196 RepID=A0AAD4H9C7_9FUNG|nr:hypothetical protein BGZ95_004431 [Linnemannia exigua]